MRYSVYINNYIGYSECRMSNGFRFIIDNFNQLTIHYIDNRPSVPLSTDPDVINKFRRKVLKRITEYAEQLKEEL